MLRVIDMLDQVFFCFFFSKDAKKGNTSDVVTARIIFLFRTKIGTPKNTTQILTHLTVLVEFIHFYTYVGFKPYLTLYVRLWV